MLYGGSQEVFCSESLSRHERNEPLRREQRLLAALRARETAADDGMICFHGHLPTGSLQGYKFLPDRSDPPFHSS